jgi:hypothetical protein
MATQAVFAQENNDDAAVAAAATTPKRRLYHDHTPTDVATSLWNQKQHHPNGNADRKERLDAGIYASHQATLQQKIHAPHEQGHCRDRHGR